VVPEDLENNATLVAMLTYLADKDPSSLSHDVVSTFTNFRTGEVQEAKYSCPKADRNTAASPR
jgi:hypothetical protein